MPKASRPANTFLLIFSFILIFLLVAWQIAQSTISNLESKHIQRISQEMNNNAARLIEAKRKNTLAVTLALADNQTIKSILTHDNIVKGMNESTKSLSQELRKYTKYKNVWIQIIDSKGISRSRSWVEKYGDQISLVRPDVRMMQQSPHIMETISTGKFSISFKSMVPIYDAGKFIGMVEVITHFNSIIKELEKSDIHSIALVDKQYQSQLTRAVSKTFIDGYYVANFDVKPELVEKIKQLGVSNLVEAPGFIIHNEHLFTVHKIAGVNNESMGYFVQILPTSAVSNPEIDSFIHNFILIGLMILSVGLIITSLIYRNKKIVEREHQFLQSITDSSTDLMIICKQGLIISANKAFLDMYPGLTGERIEEFSRHFVNLTPVKKPLGSNRCHEIFQLETNKEHDLEIKHGDQIRTFSLNIQPLAGRTDHCVLRFMDITDRREAEEKIKLSANVFTHAREGIMITERDGTIIDVNESFLHITGYGREEVIGQKPDILNSGHHGSVFFDVLWQDLLEKGYWNGEIWNRKKDGTSGAQMLTISAVEEEHGTRHFVALLSDITALKEQQKQLEMIANFDPLTGLPNRRYITQLLHQKISEAEQQNFSLAVFYLDLDGFKAINDTHSHDFGDKLLKTLALRMSETLDDQSIVGRVGGDEFIGALVNHSNNKDACKPLLIALLEQLSKPIFIQGFKLQISASIGVTFYSQNSSNDADKLVREADQAMYQAKLSGKNRYHFFDAEKDLLLRGHHEATEKIRRGFENQQFVLHYQPKINLETGQLIGAEALIRWQHPDKGLILPGHFIPTISTHPLSIDVGEWVIQTALNQIKEWQEKGLQIPISVNVSPLQLQDMEFPARIKALLEQTPEVEANLLCIEVLETHALENITEVFEVINQCRDMGIRFSLDDFGTGYSSLNYLKQLPVDELKIDRSFVQGMLNNPEDLAIIEATLGLSGTFGHKVIAEGVETEEQGIRLLQLGCKNAQGFFICKPIDPNSFEDWASSWQQPESWKLHQPIKRKHRMVLDLASSYQAWFESVMFYTAGECSLKPESFEYSSFTDWVAKLDDNHSSTRFLALSLMPLFSGMNTSLNSEIEREELEHHLTKIDPQIVKILEELISDLSLKQKKEDVVLNPENLHFEI
jgi:diguanylate cyclase (GGDEF)-like protein/PAS domain S-box-containing protein